jgi:predicted secreted protein
MIRKKELVLVSHCILNQNTVINGWERAQGGFNHIVRDLIDRNVGIIQLPCPELMHLGCNRPPQTKEEYTTAAYIALCSRLAKDQVDTLLKYKDNGYHLLGLIGISKSPTCDTLGKRGVFMEIFLNLCAENDIEINTIDVDEDYMEGKSTFNITF